ncbi:MAG: transketolase [Deltaproteobacteria bacterium]|jgi:transketolase|nr:transketolase [Deltaproteobacteria bacterium]
MILSDKPLDELCINTIRFLSVDAVQQANSGHPGMPMGAAPMAYVLWTKFLRHSPKNPGWPDRDRFVLSAGHGSMLLYSLLHLTGYDLSLDEIKNFRQWGSKTPGHPEYGDTPGVETTTGPLGQGFAMGVGMAIAEQHLAARYNRPGHEIVNHFTYGIVSDGDIMEGISHEAASLAGHLKLGKLIYLYDDNKICIEGKCDLAFTDDTLKRFSAYGWQVQQVDDGNDLYAIAKALETARDETARPSLIAVRTSIGYGSPNRQDTAKAHGEPLGEEERRLTKEKLGWPQKPTFYIPDEALHHFRKCAEKGLELEQSWTVSFRDYLQNFPAEGAQFEKQLKGELPSGWDKDIPDFPADPKGTATRVTSGIVLNAIARNVPALMGGSADLAPSNKTMIDNEDSFQAGSYDQRNIHFGVREFGMTAVLNGMALHGGLIPYGGTFLIFSDYMRPAIRLASLMKQHVIYVLTHDSIGLGEDGPTHQPIEHLASLRAMPNLTVLRPADANETAEAWKFAIKNNKGPMVLALTRQSLPTLDRSQFGPANSLQHGAYVLKDVDATPDALILASGSEVKLALEAADRLAKAGTAARVISMPSWELFDAQPQEYKDFVLPENVPVRVAVEAGATQGWHKYIGSKGEVIGLDHFGASAPMNDLFSHFNITVESVVKAVQNLSKG